MLYLLKGGIDLGHGGADPGAVFGNLIEKVINYKVGTKLAEYFRLNGIEPIMTRTSDTTLSLTQRCDMLNNANVDFVICEHENAGGGDGFEVYHSINGGKGKILAENIAKQFLALGQNPHGGANGVKTRQGSNGDYYTMIKNTKAPAVITEFAFLDNAEDRKAIDEEKEYEDIARAITKGVCATFGLTFKDKPVAPPVVAPIIKPSKAKIVVYGNSVDQRAALYLADFFKCKIQDGNIPFDYSEYEVYCIGGEPTTKGVKGWTAYRTKVIAGTNRFDTCSKVLSFIKNNGK